MVNKKVSLDSYDFMAEYYFKHIDNKAYNAYYERPATLSLLPAVKGKKVLDAGCAAGWYSEWLLDKGADVTSIDFSKEMVKMTKKRLGKRGKVIKADLNEPLGFIEKGSFDIILASLVLHYIKDWNIVMKEFNKTLKLSGHLIFSVHHPFMDFTYFKRDNYFQTELLEDEWDTHKGKTKVKFYRRPLKDIISQILDNGFTIEKLDEPMPTDKFKENAPKAYNKLTKKPQFLFIRAKKVRDI
ncbi:MAG: class I SAM-dependent methyltransferase [Firmicutes bacterium]|nr:class I SAM-dependent methyltransferase [Bacillota bacterium]